MKPSGKVLITGANGFTGHHACTYFRDSGYEVMAVVRKPCFEEQGVRVEICDLTKQDEVIDLIHRTKPDWVLHLAGHSLVQHSWEEPASYLETHAMSTVYLLEAIRKECPGTRIIVTGSALQGELFELATLIHPYSLSKTMQVQLALFWANSYQMDVMVAIPSNLAGPGKSKGICAMLACRIAEMERNKEMDEIMISNPKAQRDFLDVRDAVTAYETLLKHGVGGETYFVAAGRSRLIEELVSCYKSLSPVEWKVLSERQEPEEQVDMMPEKLVNLGWSPKHSLESTLEDTLNYFRQAFLK